MEKKKNETNKSEFMLQLFICIALATYTVLIILNAFGVTSIGSEYIIAFFSSAITLVVFLLTLKNNIQQHKATQETIAENNRTSILPFINFILDANHDNINIRYSGKIFGSYTTNTPIGRVIEISNIGLATAVNICISFDLNDTSINLGHIPQNASIKFRDQIPYEDIDNNIIPEITLTVNFFDLQNHQYSQIITIKNYSDNKQEVCITEPKYINENKY